MLLLREALKHRISYCRLKTIYSRTKNTISSFRRYAHRDPVRSSVLTRKRCEKLQSLFEEYHVVSMIDGFVSLGMVSDAEPAFNHYRREGHQFDVQVYNKMLFGWHQQGKRGIARMLFGSMEEDEVEPNFQTYAVMLMLHGSCSDWESAGEILRLMESKGLQPKHILYKTCLSKDQTTDILEVLDHFGIQSEAPSPKKANYPRVVQQLYEGKRQSHENTKGVSHHLCQLFDASTLEKRMQRQFEIELQGYENVPSIAVDRTEPDISGSCTSGSTTSDGVKKQMKITIVDLKDQWRKALAAVITKDVEDFFSVIQSVTLTRSRMWGPKQFPFLALLPPEMWAEIVTEVAVWVLEQPDGLPVNYLCRLIGRAAWCKYVIMTKQENGVVEKTRSMYRKYMDFLRSPTSSKQSAREFWNELDRELVLEGSLALDIPSWPLSVVSYVGTALLDRLLDIATIPESFSKSGKKELCAFYHVTEFMENRQIGYIKAHYQLYELVRKYYTKDEAGHFRMNATLLPMLVPPQPWTSVAKGGYFVSPSSIVRCHPDTYQHHLLLQQADNLSAVLDSLNCVSSSPWRINTRILDLVIVLFNGGGDDKLDIPSMVPHLPKGKDVKQMTRFERMRWKKLRNESYSLWMTMLYNLSLANHYRDEVFWLPNNMDFRGRVYPIPPHLSHLTNDVGRAILKLGVGYPLGEKGLDWLKIHLVNLHGQKKKASLKERLEFANEMLPEIVDSADRPFEGNKWWQTSDEPWQVLACCAEITDIIRSGDPKNFVSHMFVHQDGSCNGLQHYAALGRDWLGAKQVNLLPQDRPEDPYTGVALMVEEKRKGDAKDGHEIAKLLEGKITRKVVKTTVMTVVYGVTFVGGRLQVEKQLRETDLPEELLWDSSQYIVGMVFEVLREMFSNAKVIQDWFADSARMLSLAGRPMEWHTPLGLPVVQPYHKPYNKGLKTQLQQVWKTHDMDISRPPNTRKQTSAMPPNFVHSLDATHMMLTSLYCQRAGITFVAVHDSFWTHPSSVDTMNKICREQFVALHSEPILQDLAEFWERRFGGMKYIDSKLKGSEKHQECRFQDHVPSIGDLDLKVVLESSYFFC